MREPLQSQSATERWQKRWIAIVLEFILLFAFWLLLSGHYQAKYIILGALSAGLVTFLTNDLFYHTLRRGERAEPKVRPVLLQIWRFLVYIPWLISRIIMANLQVAYIVIQPKLPIDPVLLLFRTKMRKSIAQVTLANSITLTPGTITVSLEDGRYVVHTLEPKLAQELVDAVMQNKIAKVYLEQKEQPPEVSRVYSVEDLKQ